jgi:glucose 1-dehydrogenase
MGMLSNHNPQLRSDVHVTTRRCRSIVVAGAAGGIGSAIVRHLVSSGDEVTGIDRDQEMLTALASDLAPSGSFTALTADLEIASDVAEVMETACQRSGHLDGLVNAAGVISRHDIRTLDVSEWDRVININLRAPFLTIKASLPYMSEGSVIVNITSIQATIASADLPHYSASKGGLAQLTKSLAICLAPEGIRVVAVAPGTTATRMNEARRQNADLNAAYLSRIPLGRLVDPVDVAKVVAFVLSDAARSITGSSVVVDGGLLATR